MCWHDPLWFLQHPCSELRAASVVYQSCARKWGATEYQQCLHQSAWKLEGQVPKVHVSVFLIYLFIFSRSRVIEFHFLLWTHAHLSTERTAAPWMSTSTGFPSHKPSPSRVTQRANRRPAAPPAPPLSAAPRSSSMVEPGITDADFNHELVRSAEILCCNICFFFFLFQLAVQSV